MEDFSEVRRAIKEEYGDAIPVAPALIQLYTTDGAQLNKENTQIKTWSQLKDLPEDYFVEESGLFLTVEGTST